MTREYADAAARFKRDTANHQMTVLHDDGLYRHIRFRGPRSEIAWFELVTWPGALTISGDMGGYTFRRVEDMFAFFRQSSGYGINPQYWSEKLDGDRDTSKHYSEELFSRLVAEDLKEAERNWPGVTEAWEEKVNGIIPEYFTGTEHEARQALESFEFGTVFKASCTCGAFRDCGSEDAADTWRFITHPSHDGHKATVRREGFWFEDTWHWDLTDYTAQFLWCCHAIVWGIAQYDRRPAGEVAHVG